MPAMSDAPDDTALARMLGRVESVAVVGASPDPSRTSHQIAVWLMENTPYEVYLVNPFGGEADIQGHGFYPDLASLPLVPDLVDVFRRPEEVPSIADAAIAVGARALWLQLGIRHDDAAATAHKAGLAVVQNRCIKIEYRRLRDRIEVARAVRG
jgi:predicted CoA-binding protein